MIKKMLKKGDVGKKREWSILCEREWNGSWKLKEIIINRWKICWFIFIICIGDRILRWYKYELYK